MSMMYRKAAVLAGAAAIALPRPAPERKEADPAAVSQEVKTALGDFMRTFEEFKTKNDARLKEVEQKGSADVTTREQVDKLNAALDKSQAELKKRLDEMEAKANRLALGGGGGGDREVKAAEEFSRITGQTVTAEQLREYKSGLNDHLRNPNVKAATLSVGSDPSGGYLVTPDTTGRMIKKIYESSPMRQLASVVTIGTDALEGPIDNGEADASWVGEQQPRQQTGAPQLGMWQIPVHELYAYPKVTQRLLDDARVDQEAWLADKATAKFERKENTAFVLGDGNLKPKGLLAYPVVSEADGSRAWGKFQFIATGAAGAFAVADPGDALLDLIYGLKAAYRNNARFFMSRGTVGEVRKLKDGQGNYLWQPSAQVGQPATLLGYGIAEGEDMPAITANSLSIAFGDFAEAYTIVDRLGVTVIRDNITEPGFVKFNFRKRVGGGANNFEAVKFLKFAA